MRLSTRPRPPPEPPRVLADTLWAEHTNDYDYAVPEESIEGDASHHTSVAE
ncbi:MULTISPECIES: hypothetical protein [unclassified Streptomyces]|uniref:hypothetical protein n=1 Tax=unclassified Streptomyces TaxID=2593676 RepID=UPI00403C2A83